MYTFPFALYAHSTVADVKKAFSHVDFFSLPILDSDGRMLGIIKIKDFIDEKDPHKNIYPYISKDYLCIERPDFVMNAIKPYYENLEKYSEIYIVDYVGKLVEVVSTLYFIKGKIVEETDEVMDETEFLRQIVKPTSLARCILDTLDSGVIVVNKKSKILYVNPTYSNILGLAREKVLGKYLKDIEPAARILKTLETEKHVLNRIFNISTLNIKVLANITPIRYNDKFVGAISVFSDITRVTNMMSRVEETNIINSLLAEEMAAKCDLPPSFTQMVGKSIKFRKQLTLAVKTSAIDSPVLILGESGTGKELLAKAIHENSDRKDDPFVSINCAAIPDHLLESELFGYEAGAFTGAKKTGKIGKFEQANGGSLFLDEIGDMPLIMQTKLLRFLQDKELNRIGSTKATKLDVRIISATNKNLDEMVEQKTFRDDLLYRLNVFTLKLPPLRERKIDIWELLVYYRRYYENKYNKKVAIAPSCLKVLLNYNWPGNARELKNTVENLVVMADKVLTVNDLPDRIKNLSSFDEQEDIKAGQSPENFLDISIPQTKKENGTLIVQTRDAERRAIMAALAECKNNKSRAMKLLGISRRTFYKKLKDLNI